MTDKPKNKNRKKSLIISSIVKVLLIIVLIVACNSFDFIELKIWYFTSGRKNNITVIKHPDEEATYKLICKNGYFSYQNERVKEKEVEINEETRWNRTNETNYDYIIALAIKEEKVVWIVIIQVVRDKVYQGDYHPIILQQGYLIIPREESEVRNLIDQYIEQKERTRISLWDRNLKE